MPARRLLPVVMAATPGPTPPGASPPKHGFFTGVTRQLMDISKQAGNSASGQWAGRFAAAINQYLAAEAALQRLQPKAAKEAQSAPAYKAACQEVALRLDVVLRMKDRAPADVVAQLGHLTHGDDDAACDIPEVAAWASVGRALTLERLMLAGQAKVGPVQPVPESQRTSLVHLEHLLMVIDEVRIDVPDVTRWSIDIKEALAFYTAAERTLAEKGPGFGGLHVLNALDGCDALLKEEARLPFTVGTFTNPKGNFNASQRWINAAGNYLRRSREHGSMSERVRNLLTLRKNELAEMARPYEPTST